MFSRRWDTAEQHWHVHTCVDFMYITMRESARAINCRLLRNKQHGRARTFWVANSSRMQYAHVSDMLAEHMSSCSHLSNLARGHAIYVLMQLPAPSWMMAIGKTGPLYSCMSSLILYLLRPRVLPVILPFYHSPIFAMNWNGTQSQLGYFWN